MDRRKLFERAFRHCERLAEHVEDLAAQGAARLCQLIQQLMIDVALSRLLGDQIPELLYAAVAEVLAYIYQLRRFNSGGIRGGIPPQPPRDLPVPVGLDPEGTPA